MHPLDLLGADAVPELAWLPGMDLPTARRGALFVRAMTALGRWFDLGTMERHARDLLTRHDLPLHCPEPTAVRPRTASLTPAHA